MRRLAVAVAGLLTSGAIVLGAQTPTARKSVKDGLYTDAQATRGKAAYEKNCAECHSADLSGHEYAGALAGFGFQLKWQDASVAELYGRARSMPLGRSNSLTTQEYLDIVAYILQKNTYPAGSGELTTAVAAQRWPRVMLERLITAAP